MILDLIDATSLELRDISDPHLHVHGDAGGEGFGPLQMFAASLALCAASVLQAYARGPLQVDLVRLRLRLEWEYAQNPRRVARVATSVTWPELPPGRRNAVLHAIESCTIHRTLEQSPALGVAFRDDAAPEAAAGPGEPESVPPRLAERAEVPISEASPSRSRL